MTSLLLVSARLASQVGFGLGLLWVDRPVLSLALIGLAFRGLVDISFSLQSAPSDWTTDDAAVFVAVRGAWDRH